MRCFFRVGPYRRLLQFGIGATMAALALGELSAAPRVIEARRIHLGTPGLAEWAEFERSQPHGGQLEVVFTAEASASEAMLFIRQQNVKATWRVLLNGRPLGALETLSQPLVRALAIPAGGLRAGENRLAIVRVPSPLVDDIVIDEIAFDPQPRDEALGAELNVVVTDAATGEPMPCRLTLVDATGALVPVRAVGEQRLTVRTGVVYTGTGQARLALRPGRYRVYASRGFEFSAPSEEVALASDAPGSLALSLRREVPTPGLIAADTHIHTLTHSGHGDATIDERMLTIAGEGIEFAVATDHNHHTDFAPAAARMEVARRFRSVVGNEVTTAVGHFNAFPVAAGSAVPNHEFAGWPDLLAHVRKVTGATVITLNHPRDVHRNFAPFGPANFDPRTGELRSAPGTLDVDAIEVITSAAMQSDPMLLFHDWFALLNRGHRVAGIAASDTHHVSEFILGQARTYIVSPTDDPAEIDPDVLCRNLRDARASISFGLLARMTVDGRFAAGDFATNLGEQLEVTIEVLGPSWVSVDWLQLFANGVLIRDEPLAAEAGPVRVSRSWTLPRPRHDVHLVAVASGPGVTAPFWETPRPYQPTSKVFVPRVLGATNPIWIDGDGDGQFTPPWAREENRLTPSGK